VFVRQLAVAEVDDHDQWDFDKVYAEMKDYDFYTRFGHGDMKKFVEDYWQRIQTMPVAAVAGSTK